MTTAQARRQKLWQVTSALLSSDHDPAATTARARRLRTRLEASSLTVGDLLAAPAWLSLAPAELSDLARRTGAAAMAVRWRATVDGAVLRRAAQAVGAPMLRRLLDDTTLVDAGPADPGAMEGHAAALEAVGCAVLKASVSLELASRLEGRLRPYATVAIEKPAAGRFVAAALVADEVT